MENRNEAAFPTEAKVYEDGKHMNVRFRGLTKREIFAKDAPPPPNWFEHKSNLKKPTTPKTWDKLYAEDKLDGDVKSDIVRLKQWHHDPCFDLPSHLEWYQKEWEDYHEQFRIYEAEIMKEKYFAWRLYFADTMLNLLDQQS